MITLEWEKRDPSIISLYQQLANQGFDNFDMMLITNVLQEIMNEMERQEILISEKTGKQQKILKYKPLI
jgi:hypothetical protein